MPATRIPGIPGDECQCGRRMSIRHCTLCGSTRIYARINKMHTLINGEKKFVETQFRCQGCGHLFIEEERQWCDAPPVTAALARQKLQALADAKGQGENLSPEDEQLAQASGFTSQQKGILKTAKAFINKAKDDNALSSSRLRTSWFQLRSAYIDAEAEAKQKGESLPQSLEEFLVSELKAIGHSQENIAKVLQWQREEVQNEQQPS